MVEYLAKKCYHRPEPDRACDYFDWLWQRAQGEWFPDPFPPSDDDEGPEPPYGLGPLPGGPAPGPTKPKGPSGAPGKPESSTDQDEILAIGTSGPEQSAIAADPKGSRALIIGIDDYSDPGAIHIPRRNLSSLSELRDLMATAFQGGAELIRNPSLTTLWQALTEKAVTTEGTLFVYFAGHGFTDGRTSDTYLGAGNMSLNAEGMLDNVLNLRDVRYLLAQSNARNRVLVLDCCFSGSMTAGTSLQIVATRPSGGLKGAPQRALPEVSLRPTYVVGHRTEVGSRADGFLQTFVSHAQGAINASTASTVGSLFDRVVEALPVDERQAVNRRAVANGALVAWPTARLARPSRTPTTANVHVPARWRWSPTSSEASVSRGPSLQTWGRGARLLTIAGDLDVATFNRSLILIIGSAGIGKTTLLNIAVSASGHASLAREPLACPMCAPDEVTHHSPGRSTTLILMHHVNAEPTPPLLLAKLVRTRKSRIRGQKDWTGSAYQRLMSRTSDSFLAFLDGMDVNATLVEPSRILSTSSVWSQADAALRIGNAEGVEDGIVGSWLNPFVYVCLATRVSRSAPFDAHQHDELLTILHPPTLPVELAPAAGTRAVARPIEQSVLDVGPPVWRPIGSDMPALGALGFAEPQHRFTYGMTIRLPRMLVALGASPLDALDHSDEAVAVVLSNWVHIADPVRWARLFALLNFLRSRYRAHLITSLYRLAQNPPVDRNAAVAHCTVWLREVRSRLTEHQRVLVQQVFDGLSVEAVGWAIGTHGLSEARIYREFSARRATAKAASAPAEWLPRPTG
ncbi:caspase family protein [Virgisporangium aurantiacum]|uniref:Peptidase C14 caspase domain-containing protein n=1 Tax=Virgisporangium aurantiacum TaxID=175570 RepID=A0A8J3ZIS1_9ACTN|nr:caspase family protein [Virgisporangium aurantiacum]GIJ64649.1 hypothetical protein Vau01_121650 [Virgisporangium aurantiacum]